MSIFALEYDTMMGNGTDIETTGAKKQGGRVGKLIEGLSNNIKKQGK